MAYPYYPTYQPYASYLPPQMQMQQQPQQAITYPQNQAQPQVKVSDVWISCAEEADVFPVAPNNAVRLWSTKEPVFYLKQADATGRPTMRIYDLVERSEIASTASEAQERKVADFATKEELGAVSAAMKSLLSDIEQIKGDLYGMAGRKKVKKEADSDDT